MFKKIHSWMMSVARVMRRELNMSVTDVGVLLFFVFLPLAYPIIYTLIYNPEVAREIQVIVVDDSRTTASRELVRMADATESIHVTGYAADMSEARHALNTKECYGIIHIPSNYGRSIGRGEQAHVIFYSDMGLLLRYRTMLMSLTNLQLAAGATLRTETMSSAGLAGSSMSGSPVENVSYMLGDTEQGFASFIIPGIIVLILQQSIILGLTLIGGTRYERRAAWRVIAPRDVAASPSATVTGRMLAVMLIYMPLTIYVLHYIPIFFSLPHIGSATQYLPFIVPMLIASAFMGMTVEVLVKEREMSFMVVVFTSVIFLFLSGITWPRYAMNSLWQSIGNMIPAVWGMEGFTRINSNNATLYDNTHCYLMMWALAIFYFVTALLVEQYHNRRFDRPPFTASR